MSEIKVNKITPRAACGTTQLGDSGDTFTIPSGATITNAGTASGFGATGEISWDTTVKTTGTFTATSGVGYFLNTTGGSITVNLAAGTAGDSVAMVDYAGTWQTSNVTVAANGTEKIGGVDADVTLNTEGQSVTFVYIDGTQGWINVLDSTSNVRANPFIVATGGCITTSGDYKIHTFLSPNTFTVTNAGAPSGSSTVDYLVVAGGGAGGPTAGTSVNGAGGGAGGYRESSGAASGCYAVSPLGSGVSALPVSVQGYPITAGGGGTATPWPGKASCVAARKGTPSVFSAIISTGGGASGYYQCGPEITTADKSGGSGGGGGHGPSKGPAGTGDTPPTTPDQGFDGGAGSPTDSDGGTGGGGGATAVGASVCSTAGGNGGAGATSSINTTPTVRAGGGGGGGQTGFGTGGPGGGGQGARGAPNSASTAGTINTGGGGGGGNDTNAPGPFSDTGKNGGSGIVIIRYKYQ